jgi:hypothetical protein
MLWGAAKIAWLSANIVFTVLAFVLFRRNGNFSLVLGILYIALVWGINTVVLYYDPSYNSAVRDGLFWMPFCYAIARHIILDWYRNHEKARIHSKGKTEAQ